MLIISSLSCKVGLTVGGWGLSTGGFIGGVLQYLQDRFH